MLHLTNSWKSYHLLTRKTTISVTAASGKKAVTDCGIKWVSSGEGEAIMEVISDEVMIESFTSNGEEEMKEKRKDAMAKILCGGGRLKKKIMRGHD